MQLVNTLGVIKSAFSAFDQQMEQVFKEMVPPLSEMEKILARRKNPREREKVIKFYKDLLVNISDEIDGRYKQTLKLIRLTYFVIPAKVELESNETVNGLVEQLINDLRKKGEYAKYEQMNERQRRFELLNILYEKVLIRTEKVKQLFGCLERLATQNLHFYY